MLELALTCLEGAALGKAVMILQEAADDSEALASDALFKATQPGAGVTASRAVLEATASLDRIERAELAAASRWAAHVRQSRELARRALEVAAGGGQATRPGRLRGLDSSV